MSQRSQLPAVRSVSYRDQTDETAYRDAPQFETATGSLSYAHSERDGSTTCSTC
jgi:hypothetical protein